MKRLSSLGTIFLLLISTFLIPTPQDAQSSPISIFSFQTDLSPVLVGQNFTYSIKVKNLDNKPIYVIPISHESFDPPDSVNIVKDVRLISVSPKKLDPGEVVTVNSTREFTARRAGEVRITVYVSWSYSEEYSMENPWYEISETFSFMIYESQQETYKIYFSTEPPDVGSITFSGINYTSGQSGEHASGTYQIEADFPEGYIFYNWSTTGEVSVVNSGSRQTTASVTGNGSLIAVFRWSVKLRGTVKGHVQYTNGLPAVDVEVEELLLDTSNRLKVGEVVEVYRETPFTEINDGDRVEVYGLGFWIGSPERMLRPYVKHGIVIEWPEHYIRNNYNFTIRIVNLLDRYNEQGLSFKILFPNNTESIVLVNNSYTFINHPQGVYHIKPNRNYILTNTSYFYIDKNNQLINIGYVNLNLITNIIEQNRTIERLENQIKKLTADYSQLLYTNILNIQQLSIFTYAALTIAITLIIFTTVNTGRTLNRLKRIEEFIKNLVEDTEIE